MKRTDYISWDEYFMGVALLSAQRSKDNSTQVGACIVNDEKKIVSVGLSTVKSNVPSLTVVQLEPSLLTSILNFLSAVLATDCFCRI